MVISPVYSSALYLWLWHCPCANLGGVMTFHDGYMVPIQYIPPLVVKYACTKSSELSNIPIWGMSPPNTIWWISVGPYKMSIEKVHLIIPEGWRKHWQFLLFPLGFSACILVRTLRPSGILPPYSPIVCSLGGPYRPSTTRSHPNILEVWVQQHIFWYLPLIMAAQQ